MDKLPSIWLKSFYSWDEYSEYILENKNIIELMDEIDNRFLASPKPFILKGFCSVCNDIKDFKFSWLYGGIDSSGRVNLARTETGACLCCDGNSRIRALFDYINRNYSNAKNVYISEEITGAFDIYKRKYPNIIGSEYYGTDFRPGELLYNEKLKRNIRHEDLTNLSFGENKFDLIISQDVFEHIPNYKLAFREIYRVLKPNGALVFTIPFFPNNIDTVVRATFNKSNGSITHLLPPEIHGNPLSEEGSLCFQNFGWDLLSTLKDVGFVNVRAEFYWGVQNCHFGFPSFVMVADRKV